MGLDSCLVRLIKQWKSIQRKGKRRRRKRRKKKRRQQFIDTFQWVDFSGGLKSWSFFNKSQNNLFLLPLSEKSD